MPASRASVLEHKPATELRPGESGIRLKDDPYYGKVDIGPAAADAETKTKDYEKKEKARISQLPADQRPAAEEKLGRELAKRRKEEPTQLPAAADTAADQRVTLGALQENIESGVHALDGEEQTHVEVLTGKRLQQRAPAEAPREPEILPPGETGHPVGPEGKDSVLEPAERDRDKTKAAKPGESAKGER